MSLLLRLPVALLVLPVALFASISRAAQPAPPTSPVVELINNQPFPIRMPLRLRLPGHAFTGSAGAVQRIGDDVLLIANVPAGARAQVTATDRTTAAKPAFSLAIERDGVRLNYAGQDQGRLTWDIIVRPAKGAAFGEPGAAPVVPNYAPEFSALPLVFQRRASGPVADVWTADAIKSGLRLELELVAYADGFLDVNARLRNESASPETGVQAAVLVRWEQPPVRSRVLCADNRVSPLAETDLSPFRRGEGRHLYTQRGVDWIETTFASGSASAWLNDFAPSFTLHDNSSKNSFNQPRYYGANVPQLGQEVQTVGQQFFSITEIARANTRSYRDRMAAYALPARGEGVSFSSRLMFAPQAFAPSQVDQTFVGYTSYNAQQATPTGAKVEFGTESVRFGTSYFPYSTLGENFDTWKMPGMDRESFWPLAADTVLRWREFAAEIRRDLRLLKAMGFQVVRLHHLELLAPIPADIRREYLDFLFAEMRHLKLRAMLDVYASPESITEVVARYADVVDSVELENEVLIWGIPLDRPELWMRTYHAIKKAAPHVRVHLTGYNNTGMFQRLQALGVPFDRIGLHSYVDSAEAVPTARGYALALGSFASKTGKSPVITEWNWRGLTRLTPEARAAMYSPIFEHALATRAVPEMHQFQFQETLAPNPRSGRGSILRHYELVHLSRRPKVEAFELMKLIRKYSGPVDAFRLFEIPPVIATVRPDETVTTEVRITNHDRTPARLQLALESSPELLARLTSGTDATIAPGATATVPIELTVKGGAPGFYHCFVRVETEAKALRYGVIEVRLPGQPKLDLQTPAPANVAYPQTVAEALKVTIAAPCVIYGQDAPALEVETAIAIAETLESATGYPIKALQAGDATEARAKAGTVILVGTAKADPLIADIIAKSKVGPGGFVVNASAEVSKPCVVIGGGNSETVSQAGMEFLLRYWKSAKDSGARRVGLEKKILPRGLDATKLP